MEEKIRQIILNDFKASEIKARDGVDIYTIIDRWISNILALNEIADEASEEIIQDTQEVLARIVAAILITVNGAPILVPLIVNPLLEDEAIREYINRWADANPVKETDKTKTVLDITIERD